MQQDNMDNQACKEAVSFRTHSSSKLWLLVLTLSLLHLSKKIFLPVGEKKQPKYS